MRIQGMVKLDSSQVPLDSSCMDVHDGKPQVVLTLPPPKGRRSCEQTIRLEQETFCNLLLKGVVGKDAVWHSRQQAGDLPAPSSSIDVNGGET